MLGSLFPLIYGALFVALLWQAFRVMSKGFRAASAPLNSSPSSCPLFMLISDTAVCILVPPLRSRCCC